MANKTLRFLKSLFTKEKDPVNSSQNVLAEIKVNYDSGDVYHSYSEGGTSYSVPLSYILDNYLSYAQNAELIHVGTTAPVNPRVKIWVDTSGNDTVASRFGYEEPSPEPADDNNG